MKGKINEIFESVQGEGMYVGERQVFVRLSGCNLSCRYCDTDAGSFEELGPDETLERIRSFRGEFHSVSFTGGEPLLQKGFLKELMALTRAAGFRNFLETNGVLPDAMGELADLTDIVAMDFKLPGSTGLGPFWKEHRGFLAACSGIEVFAKAVVCEGTAEPEILECVGVIREVRPGCVLVLQPDSSAQKNSLEAKCARFMRLCRDRGVDSCVIPQVHKLIGIK